MTKLYPRVTIGIPVYNEEKYLEETLNDILNINYPDFVIIIGDNCSTDRTEEICLEFAERNSQITYYRHASNLEGGNIEFLIEKTETDYFALLSGNNKIHKDYLIKCMEKLLANPDAGYVNSNLNYIDMNGRLIDREYTVKDNPDMSGMGVVDRLETLLDLNAWYLSYGIYKTSLYKKIHRRTFVEYKYSYGADVILNLLILLETTVVHVNEVLFFYRYKYRNEHERRKKFFDEAHTPCFPSAELTLNIIDIVNTSDMLKDEERKKILISCFKIFSRSSLWLGRYNNYSDLDYLDRDELSQKRNRLYKMLPYRPSTLFLKECRIPEESEKPRVAIFEFNHRHDEVIPSTVFQLIQMGYDVDVFMKDEETYNNNIWKCFPSLVCNIHIMEEADANYDKFIYWIKAFKMLEYEFTIVNSLEPRSILDFVSYLPGRHYSILHNPSIMMQHKEWQDYYSKINHKPLFLHSMVTSKLTLFNNAACFPPFLEVENYNRFDKNEDVVTFVIQGNLEARRNYPMLIQCIDALYNVREELPPFEFLIVGNCTTQYGVEIRRIIEGQPWSKIVTFSEGELDYPDFYGKIATADYLVPLLDKSEKRFQPYFEDKLTSSVSVAFMLNIPPIIHEDLANIYNISGITYNDEKDGLLQALLYALQLPKEERLKIETAIAEDRADILHHAGLVAKKYFQIEYSEKIHYYQQEAVNRIKMGNIEGAKEFGLKILDIVPNNPTAIEILATAERVDGNWEEALEYYLKLYELAPTDEISSEIRAVMTELNDPRINEWGGETKGWIERFDKYVHSGMREVHGWVGKDFYKAVQKLNLIQEEKEIQGDFIEIGVHHGKFTLLLDQLRRKGEKYVAIDLFDNQVLNIDNSGLGNRAIFEKNVQKWSSNPDTMKIISIDSLTLSAECLAKESRGFRFFSIDGGHTVEHTINDLILASNTIAPGGVIFLDDYYNLDWPGVHEGFVKYMHNHNCRIAPFAYFQNKLILCGISYHQMYTEFFYSLWENEGYKVKEVVMSGFKTLAVSDK